MITSTCRGDSTLLNSQHKSSNVELHITRASGTRLSPPEEPKPPPAAHEIVRVPVDEEGREIEAP